MALLLVLILCIVIATPLSALYSGYVLTGTVYYQFDVTAAVVFSLTGLLCALAARQLQSGGQPSSASTQQTRKSSKRARKGRQQGTVKWFNGAKGFGFISCDNGEELFVHFRSLQKGSKRLSPGLKVEFSVGQGAKGPEAEDVAVI